MQKVLNILEAYVEWIALGIAVLFVGWVAWAYIVTQPVSKPFEGQLVTPGTVDTAIEEGPVSALNSVIHGSVDVPTFKVLDFSQDLQKGLALTNVPVPSPLASSIFDYAPFTLKGGMAIEANAAAAVRSLPNLPAAVGVMTATGLDTITPPAAAAQPAAVNAVAPAGQDVKMTVAGFTIPWQPLFDEWKKSFGPPASMNPADFLVLSVTAYRNEKTENGWGGDEEIAAQPNLLPAYPQAGNKGAEAAYVLSVGKQPSLVTAPALPTVTAGAQWKDPLALLPGAANNSVNPNPGFGVPPGGPPPIFNGGPPPNFNGGPPPQSPGAGGQTMGESSDPMIVAMQFRGGGGPPSSFGGGVGGPRARSLPTPENTPPPPPPPVAPAPGTIDPVVNLLNKTPVVPAPIEPAARIQPLSAPADSPDIFVYIIDMTAKSNHTYRYHIVYRAYNPLFNHAPDRAKDPKWVDQFDLVAPRSSDSPEITIPQSKYIFCGKNALNVKADGPFPFEVITWSNGKWHRGNFTVSPGDPIGAIDTGIDYTTGYAFGEFRSGIRKKLVTLMDEGGDAEVLDVNKDSSSKEHKDATAWVDQPNAANGAPMPFMGGPPAMPFFGGVPGGPAAPPPS